MSIEAPRRRGSAPTTRRSEYDVSDQIDTTDHTAVNREIRSIFHDLYPAASPDLVSRAVADVATLYRGEWPAYYACDTTYHNLQHVLEVTLAMARLMDGHERSRQRSEALGPRLFSLGVVTALFHDVGYLRRRGDTRHRHGAEYTLRHVSRGARFLEHYLASVGMSDLAAVAAQIIHFTGYEIPVHQIKVSTPRLRMLGNMLGTADIIAQMADRCYLEKCRDRLYPEFVHAGLANAGTSAKRPPAMLFDSVEDLLRKTPGFYDTAKARLTEQLGAVYHFVRDYFDGHNLYLDEVAKNIRYVERVAESGDLKLLRRVPPPRQTHSALTVSRDGVKPYAFADAASPS